MGSSVFNRLPHAAFHLALAACLVIVAADAEAKGGRRSGGSSSSKSHSKADSDSSGPTISVRTSSSSSSSSSQGQSDLAGSLTRVPGAMVRSGTAAAQEPMSPEEAARRTAQMEAYDKEQAEKTAAARIAAAERAEAVRLAKEKGIPVSSLQQTPEEKAAAAKLAAEAEKDRREKAVPAAEANLVLQRAMTDYPILKTPAGQPYLQLIIDRQKALVERGLYPSVAMVEAVADHASTLSRLREPLQVARAIPVSQPAPMAMPVPTAAPAAADAGQGFGGCRWVTPTRWACE